MKKLLKLLGKRYIYRSAKTGRFVPRIYAKRHPATTVREELR